MNTRGFVSEQGTDIYMAPEIKEGKVYDGR